MWVDNKVVQRVPKVRYQVFFTVIEADETSHSWQQLKKMRLAH